MAKRKGSYGSNTKGASTSKTGGATKSKPAMPTPPRASNRNGEQRGR